MSEVKSIASLFGIKTPDKISFNDTILLVESQNDMRMIVAHQLNKLGYKKIKQCGDGHEAMLWLKETPAKVSITIAAMEMPLMGGIELLTEMRENANVHRGPFVLTMSEPDRRKIMLATESTVDGILVKPFSFNDLLPKVRQAFKIFHNPQNPEMVYEFAKDALRTDALDRAEQIYQALSKVTEKAARPYVGLARVAHKRGDHSRARELLDVAEKRNPNYVPIYVLRGQVLIECSVPDQALQEFQKAIDLSPLNPIRYEEAADLMFGMKLYKEAAELLSVALKNQLSFPSLYNYLSQAYFQLQDFKKAIQYIKHALSSEPENVRFLNQLGVCLKESEQPQEALRTYNQAIKIDPSNKSALYNKAILLQSQGKSDEALKNLKRCLEKHPNFSQAQAKIAEIEAGSKQAG